MLKDIIYATTAATLLVAVSALKADSIHNFQSIILQDDVSSTALELEFLEPESKFDKQTKQQVEMRNELLEFVQNDEKATFELLNKLRTNRVNLADIESKKIQKRDASELKSHKKGYVFEKQTKEETEMRDKLLEFFNNDPEAAFEELQNLKKYKSIKSESNAKMVEKREVFETDSLRPSPTTGNKILQDTKSVVDTHEKLLDLVRSDPNGAFTMLNELRESEAEREVATHFPKTTNKNLEVPDSYSNNQLNYGYIDREYDSENSQVLKEDLIIGDIFGAIKSRLPEVAKDINGRIHKDIDHLKTKIPVVSVVDKEFQKVSRIFGAIHTEADKIRAFNSAVDHLLDVLVPTEAPSHENHG